MPPRHAVAVAEDAAVDAPSAGDAPIELTIVMPCLNEAETLATCIRKAQQSIADLGVSGEILVADNGSSDGSPEIARRLGARVIDVHEKGYGNALLGGIAAARGTYVIMGDADDSYDFTNLGPFVEKLRAGYDLVMGNRFRGGIKPGAMPSLHRYLGNPVLTGVGRLFFHSAAGDFHCGLRGFSKTAFERMDLRTTGMEFASEMVVKATLLGMTVADVPTTLSPDGRSRPPHLRSWRDGWRHLRFLLLYCPRWLFLYPGAALMVVGLVIGAWLLPGPRTLGGIRFDIHTFLYSAAAVVLGFQAITFAVFTNLFAVTEGLRPDDPKLNRLFPFMNLETGLVAGVLLILAGVLGSGLALLDWGQVAFGDLEPSATLRTVVPSATAMTLGAQIVLTSFFLSILRLARR